jgi:hypothetical protein
VCNASAVIRHILAKDRLFEFPRPKSLEFCRAELRLGNDIDFAECLYLFNGGGIQPSMELSRDRADSSDIESFLTFVSSAAEIAIQRARQKGPNRPSRSAWPNAKSLSGATHQRSPDQPARRALRLAA